MVQLRFCSISFALNWMASRAKTQNLKLLKFFFFSFFLMLFVFLFKLFSFLLQTKRFQIKQTMTNSKTTTNQTTTKKYILRNIEWTIRKKIRKIIRISFVAHPFCWVCKFFCSLAYFFRLFFVSLTEQRSK